jgi:hypothetical protein
MTVDQQNLFWANVFRPFVFLLVWVAIIWPVTWAVQKYMKPGRFKDALLRKRWTHWGKGPNS